MSRNKLPNTLSHLYIAFIVFASIGTLIYLNSLNNSFQFDDFNVVVNNFKIQESKNIPYFFINPRFAANNPMDAGHYRPFLITSYAINYAIGGLNTIGYHIVNLAFHIGTAFLVFLILKTKAMLDFTPTLTLPRQGGENKEDSRWPMLPNYAALAAGLIFLVHPFNSEAVNYITARSSIMSGFFYLLGFYCWVKFRSKQMPVIASEAKQSEKGIASGILFPRNDHRKVFYIASLLAFIAGMLSKEVVITLPIVLWLYDLYFPNIPQSTPTLTLPRQGGGKKGGGIFSWHSYIHYIPFVFIVIIPYFVIRLFSLGRVLDKFQRSFITQLFTELPVLVRHWQMFIFPRGLSLVHDADVYHSLTWSVIACVILLVFYTGIAVYLFFTRRWRLISFFMLWFIIVLLPTTIIPLNAIFQENRGYLAFVTFSALFGVFFNYLSVRRNLKLLTVAGLIILVILYSIITVQQNTIWGDSIKLWKNAVKNAPHSGIAYAGLSAAYREHGDIFLSAETAQKGIYAESENYYVWVNAGFNHWLLGRTDETILAYQKALSIDAAHGDLWNDLAVLYIENNNPVEAERCLKNGLKVWRDYPPLYYNIGRVLLKRGESVHAINAFQKALNLNPLYLQARLDLAELFEKLGKSGDAESQYREIVRLKSLNTESRLMLYGINNKKVGEILEKAVLKLKH